VDRSGIQPLGFSLDHPGPLTLTVADARVTLAVMAGDTPRRPAPASLSEIRIGLPENFYFTQVASEVRDSVHETARVAEELGARVVPVRVPDMEALNALGRVILLAEASALYEPYLDRRDDFGADVLALLDQGRLIPATDYVNAQRLRKMLLQEFLALFGSIDCLFTPTTPIVAPRIGQRQVQLDGEIQDTRLAISRLTRGMNVLGFPALSMPCGRTHEGLPIGLQMIARPFEENLLFLIGEALEADARLLRTDARLQFRKAMKDWRTSG
jgi:aspartyl-tRNA(Asn)/glutamyl-tRNA(Gln) amidotransferase subunit A